MDHLLCARYSRLGNLARQWCLSRNVTRHLIEFRCLKHRPYSFDGTSAAELAHVVSEPIFNVARLVEPTLQQFLDSRLAGGALNRGNTSVPLGSNFCVGRQARKIDEIFRFSDGLFVERSNAHRE